MDSETGSYYKPKDDKLYGSCLLQIKLNNHAEYLKWRKYNGGDTRWDFLTAFPAIMRAEYRFHTVQDLQMITMKIVQLLQMGFRVVGTSWQLEDYESMLKERDMT